MQATNQPNQPAHAVVDGITASVFFVGTLAECEAHARTHNSKYPSERLAIGSLLVTYDTEAPTIEQAIRENWEVANYPTSRNPTTHTYTLQASDAWVMCGVVPLVSEKPKTYRGRVVQRHLISYEQAKSLGVFKTKYDYFIVAVILPVYAAYAVCTD